MEEKITRIDCNQLKTISSFQNIIKLHKHSKKINHIDLYKNFLLSSGDDDLIIIIDLKAKKFINKIYDIINGTKYCYFYQIITDDFEEKNIIYYGYKSYKIIIYDIIRNKPKFEAKICLCPLIHFEYDMQSNLLITSQKSEENFSIIWQNKESILKPIIKMKDSYYCIINNEKKNVIRCIKEENKEEVKSKIEIYSYKMDNNENYKFEIIKKFDRKFYYTILLMNTFKNFYNKNDYYLFLMTENKIEIINIINENVIRSINLQIFEPLQFSYCEPVFTHEILVGFNNGEIELFNPFTNFNKIQEFIEEKNDDSKRALNVIKYIKNREKNHLDRVVQIKVSTYYPFYVSASDEILIHLLEEKK